MQRKVNPRTAMYDSLQLDPETPVDKLIEILYKFLGAVHGTLTPVRNNTITFRYQGAGYMIQRGQVIVKDRKTLAIQIVDAADFDKLFYDYGAAEGEIKRLADFILRRYPDMIGKRIDSPHDAKEFMILETAVDVAIYMLSHPETWINLVNMPGGCQDDTLRSHNYNGPDAAVNCPKCGLVTASNTGYPAPHDCKPFERAELTKS